MADGNVKLESGWTSATEPTAGTGQKVNELVDNGSNFGVGGVACKVRHQSDAQAHQQRREARKRVRQAEHQRVLAQRQRGSQRLDYKKMSVREINPAGTAI